MSDPTQGQPSEEEIRAYLAQIREADPAAIVVQAFQMLAEGAQIKLGRSDARVLIDVLASVTSAAEGRLDPELTKQMREGVVQLQTAQVSAEREEAGAAAATPGGPAAAPTGTPGAQGGTSSQGAPQPSAPGAPQGGRPQEPPAQPLTDRLWIPGRGPGKP